MSELPLKPKKGYRFRTHKLVQVNAQRMQFRVTFVAQVIFGLFLIISVLPWMWIVPMIYDLFSQQFPLFSMMLSVPIVGLIFLILLVFLCFVYTLIILQAKMLYCRAIFFDRLYDRAWKSWQFPDQGLRLSQVSALQIVSKLCHGKLSFYSYELNFVLKNGQRVNLLDHGHLHKLREDTGVLGSFLNLPVWDIAQGER